MSRLRSFLQLVGETDVRELAALARARLARWIAPQRKPPAHAERQPVSSYRKPSAQDLDQIRGLARCEDWNQIRICRGASKGCTRTEQQGCTDCYVVPWHDTRSSAEILEAMERGDA